jgi:hypothetical protein
MNWRSVITRAIVTFLEALIAVVLVTGVENIHSLESLEPALEASIAALLSFIYNIVKEYPVKEVE